MYDMGFRDDNPGLDRFLNHDIYNGALNDRLSPHVADRARVLTAEARRGPSPTRSLGLGDRSRYTWW